MTCLFVISQKKFQTGSFSSVSCLNKYFLNLFRQRMCLIILIHIYTADLVFTELLAFFTWKSHCKQLRIQENVQTDLLCKLHACCCLLLLWSPALVNPAVFSQSSSDVLWLPDKYFYLLTVSWALWLHVWLFFLITHINSYCSQHLSTDLIFLYFYCSLAYNNLYLMT